MKSLDPASENRRITREIFNGIATIAEAFDKRACSARRDKFHARGIEKRKNTVKALFVEDRDKGRFDGFGCRHLIELLYCLFILRVQNYEKNRYRT